MLFKKGLVVGVLGLWVCLSPSTQAALNGGAISADDLGWNQLRETLQEPTMGLLPEIDLPTQNGEEIWIDGEALRYLLAPVREFGEGRFSGILERLQGARLLRAGNVLNVGIYFNEGFSVDLQDVESTPRWKPYRIHVPRTLRFSVMLKEGLLTLSGLDRGSDALNLDVKIPVLPDTVWVREVSVEVNEGKISVEAGVIGNVFTVLANGEVVTRKLSGNIWGSVLRNFDSLMMPALFFRLIQL